jgi:hypothetical protein
MAEGEAKIVGVQGVDSNNNVVQAMGLSGVQVLAGSGTSAQSTAFSDASIVRISSLSDVYLAAGTNPTAVTGSSTLFPGGNVEYFRIGSNEKIAGIGGDINITVME